MQIETPALTIRARIVARGIVERAGIDRIDALKTDIEGFEDRALLPFFATAPRALWPKRIYMETDWATRREHEWRVSSPPATAKPGAAAATYCSGYRGQPERYSSST